MTRESDPTPRWFAPMDDQSKGGADFTLVQIDPRSTTPRCTLHGAMNKVSEHGIWRCITTSGPKSNGCRAGCQEVRDE